VVLITEMLEICIQTSYDQNVQLILKSYLPVVYGTPLRNVWRHQKPQNEEEQKDKQWTAIYYTEN
jgi:hypothetical protein